MTGPVFPKGWKSVCGLTLLFAAVAAWHHPGSDFYPSRRLYYKNPRNVPTEYCPRDDTQAELQGRQCLRKCTSDEDCKSKRKRCLCDGACGLSCIKPERECPDPEPPGDLGEVRITGKTFGAKAVYSCPDKFYLIGVEERVCQADGTWSSSPPACKKSVYCTEPPRIPNARHNAPVDQRTFAIDTALQYQCHPGYMPNGFPRAKCFAQDNGTAKWFGPDFTCEPISCGVPPDILNGRRDGFCHHYLCRVTYVCQAGFEVVGKAHRTCQANGSWSPDDAPTCAPVHCEPPPNPANGKAVYSTTSFNSIVTYECKYGHMLVGESTRRCGPYKRWTGIEPQCKAPCVVPEVQFGNVTSRPLHIHSNEIEPKLPPITVLRPGTLVQHGKTVGVECEEQYEPTFNITPSSCNNGTWTTPPRCQPARCKSLPRAPRHGMVIAPKTEHSMKARYTCRDGYNLIGHNITECQYGVWQGETPTCQITYCKYLPPPEHGRVLLVGNMGLYDYRNYVTKVANNRQIMFECDRGYVLADGPQGKTCIRGEWAPKTDPPRCLPSKHPNYRYRRSIRTKRRAIKTGGSNSVLRGSRGGGGGGGVGSRRIVKKKNQDGVEEEYEIAVAPHCDVLESEYILIEVITPGEDDGTNNTDISAGAVLKVSCVQGYGVNLPNETITCQDGNWSPKVPKCDALPCKTPYIQHGVLYMGGKSLFFLESIKSDSKVEVKCSPGYNLKGQGTMVCSYGEWDVEEAPECVPAPCILPNIDHGNYVGVHQAGQTIKSGEEVDYTCGVYKKVVQGPTRCHLGAFKPSKPLCLHPSVAFNYSSTIDHGDQDHHLYGRKRKPGSSGTSSGNSFYSMGKRSCGPPPRHNFTVAYVDALPIIDYQQSYPDDTEVIYRCGTVKPKQKNRWKMICEEGQWTGQPLPCSNKTEIDDAMIKQIHNTINASCDYKKDEDTVVAFHNDHQLTDNATFPTRSVLVSRCIDIGKYKYTGTVHRTCVSGLWLGRTPKCVGNSQLQDFGLDKPPTILFRYVNGSIVQSNDGKLVLYTGTTLHMECLWIRKFGKPQWQISTPHSKRAKDMEDKEGKDVADMFKRVYQEGWVTDEARDANLEYRLTIDNAQVEDAGQYTCVTPARHSHTVDIEVKTVDCPPLPEHQELVYSTTNTQLGTRVTFSCKSGNLVVGAQELICLATGRWSASLPKCTNVECPDISLLPALAPLNYKPGKDNYNKNMTAPPKISVLNRRVNGKAIFSCPPGFMIQGNAEATCQPNGNWSSPIPLCREVECPEPKAPANGFISGRPPYKANDVAQFECHQGFMMEGRPVIVCLESGKWSRSDPVKCVQACTYPGTTIGGTISSVKFYYGIDETVTFDCADGYELVGSRLLHCMKHGKWSTSIPVCRHLNSSSTTLAPKSQFSQW